MADGYNTKLNFKGKLITSERYDATKSLRNWLYGLCALCILLIGKKGNGILSWVEAGEALRFITFIILLISGIILIITYFYSRKANLKGTINIEPENITIVLNKKETKYPINTLSSIQVEHNTYVGEDYRNQKMPDNYFGKNFISFTANNELIKFEFSIDSHYMSGKLQKLAEEWSNQGKNIEYKQV